MSGAVDGAARPDAVTVRRYRAGDRGPCLSVFDSNVPAFFVEEERAEFEAFLRDLPGPYLVVEDAGGRVVACGGWAIETGTTTADLCWGMVRGDLHGRGLGRLLTRARIDGIRAEGLARSVHLHTSQHTTGFYERLGFVRGAVVPDGYAPGLHRCDMRLDLGTARRADAGPAPADLSRGGGV